MSTTAATNQIYNHKDSRYDILLRYFEWLEKHSKLSQGELLEHKLYVSLFLVQNPDAEWAAV